MSVLASEDVRVVRHGDREVVVLGTAHVSRESVELVRSAIDELRPDAVCVELDAKRFEALARPDRFEALDLREVIRTRQLATLGLNLALASYQRSLGVALGVKPGAELLEAARCAEAAGIPVALCDRDVRITLRRAWRALSFWKRSLLLGHLLCRDLRARGAVRGGPARAAPHRRADAAPHRARRSLPRPEDAC